MADASQTTKPENRNEEAPSMEEILQSIRGVISGDEGAPKPANAPNTATTENDDVLELTEMAEEETTETATASAGEAAEQETAAQPEAAEAPPAEKSVLDNIDEAIADEPDAAPAESHEDKPEAAPAAVQAEADDDVLAPSPKKSADKSGASSATKAKDRLINEPTAERSSASFKTLVDHIPKVHLNSPELRSGTTVEDLVVEALRPALAAWLNENLATIVKQLVEKEIKRLIPQDEEN